MKRFAVAALVAVAVTFAAQQKASAQGGWYWKGNIGLNFSWDAVMGCYGCQGPSCGGYGGAASGYPPLYYGYYGAAQNGYGYGPQPYAQAYPAPSYAAPARAQQPTAPAAPAVAQQTPTTTQIGYYYYPYAYSYYGYQAPSYWYGR
jgi:hypothetical protein